jgi:NodT family efflux transporter outer membrane factor (OMF) lipoprotein
VPLDVPADLIGRRADLSAARWRVEASVRDIESARARFYPNINLGALIGLNSIGLDRLFEGSSWQAAAAPAIRLPIFEAGRLRAALRARQAELDLAVASYNQVLLDAVREVADRLGTLRGIGEQLDEHARAQVAAQAQLEIARQRLQAGLGNRMAVLAAEGGVIVQRQQELELRTRLLENRLGLIRALGGGYAADPVTLSIRTQP